MTTEDLSKPAEPGHERRPVMADPGAAGWPDEPRVSDAELLLYGDLAGVVRTLGAAAVSARDAYGLMCRHANESPTDRTRAEHEDLARCAWDAYHAAQAAYREVAGRAATEAGEPDWSLFADGGGR